MIDALYAQHATELALLERIYYINNNQHRLAIFWHRVVEARRYSRRLTSFDVPLLVTKPQKGAWTHYPPAFYLKSFCSRLRTCTMLLDKFLTHTLTVIHSVLTLTMQNGAFLHLVVTLTAIVARLAHLSTCLHLFDKLYLELKALPPPPQLEGGDTETPSFSAELTRRAVSDGDLDVSVDLGEAVAREPTPRSRPKSRSTSPILPISSPWRAIRHLSLQSNHDNQVSLAGLFFSLCAFVPMCALSVTYFCSRYRSYFPDPSPPLPPPSPLKTRLVKL
ncbi:hypothetical protein BGW80DRAFT_1267225 [Lactifluus volemus]|nr:hypothetical protein BGW80DRAFT_1267225 [Lactifluus volemus]